MLVLFMVPFCESFNTRMIALLFFCLALPVARAGLTLTANPQEVDASVANATVTVTCTADGTGTLTTVTGLVIETQLYGDWGVVAQINTGDSQPTVAYSKATASGFIGGAGQTSKLEVYLSGADAGGQYKCKATGLDSSQNFATDTATAEVTILNSGGCCNALADIETRLQKTEDALASGSGGSWNEAALASINGEDLFNLLTWPAGRYTILMANTGCPHQGFSYVDWKDTGYRQFHTESTSPTNEDQVSPGSHLKQPIQSQSGADHFMYLYFCTDLSLAEKGPEWPQGSYCILKYAACPDGFHEGNMKWDDENTANKNKYAGYIPSAWFAYDTVLYFCCRRDASADQAIILPTAKPFYLFRFMGKCQKVAGTRVSNEYLVFDTENTGNNLDAYSNDYHPDGQLDNVRVELCYYERNV